jgi:hypothetical protein
LGKAFVEMYYALHQRDIAGTRGHTPEKSIRELCPRYEKSALFTTGISRQLSNQTPSFSLFSNNIARLKQTRKSTLYLL